MANNPITDEQLAELDRLNKTAIPLTFANAAGHIFNAYPALRQRLLDAESRLAESERERDAAEALVAGLRGALETLNHAAKVAISTEYGGCFDEETPLVIRLLDGTCDETDAALALTPASAGAKIKAEALYGAWQSIAALETVPAEDLRDRHINEGIRQALDVVFELRQMCDDAAEAEQEDANGRD